MQVKDEESRLRLEAEVRENLHKIYKSASDGYKYADLLHRLQ